MKTGSESIEVIIRRRRILFAGFVARMEDTKLPKCVMLRELVGGAGCTGGRKKSGWGVSRTTPLRAFGIIADQWTTAARDEGEWCETAEQKGRNEIDDCRESQGWATIILLIIRHAVVVV